MHPTAYAYLGDSVSRSEEDSANCINYPKIPGESVSSDRYIYCNGTQLRLSDSEVGSQSQCHPSYNYEWSGTDRRHLLFIFPTRVNLNTFTLRYYRDKQRGLPQLGLYAVPDEFDVWDSTPRDNRLVVISSVLPSEEPEGSSCINLPVSLLISTATKKVLMVITRSNYIFSVSEVEFYNCTGRQCMPYFWNF